MMMRSPAWFLRNAVVLGLVCATSHAQAGQISAAGDVIPLDHIEQMTVIAGRADFDEGPISGQVPPTTYASSGMRFETGLFSSILQGCAEMGKASLPSYTANTNFLSYFQNPLGGGEQLGQVVLHAGVVTFSSTVTQFGLTASRNGTQYITAWNSSGTIIGQVKWVPNQTSSFVGIDTKGVPIAMLSYGNDDVMGGQAYGISGSTIINDTWLWGPGSCDAGTLVTQGNVTALSSTLQLANIVGEASFDEGPTSGVIPLDQYAAQGMTLEADALSNLLAGVSEAGTASNPEYATTGNFIAPACGHGTIEDQHASHGAVATFSTPVTQLGLTISTEAKRYITTWDSSGQLLGQVEWTPNGSASAFIGINTKGVPIAMVALGDDDVWGGQDYNPGTDVFSDTWIWAGGCNGNNDCIDTNKCNGDETCSDGSCVPQAAPPTCDDNNGCTDDGCDTQNGCTYTNNDEPCSDGDACTTADVCSGGMCSGMTKTCDDSNTCTDDSCDSITGCIFDNNTELCDDDDACTEQDVCVDGACTGSALQCSDDEPCTTDSCDPLSGCVFEENTDPCDDGDACTEQDECAAGMCAGSTLSCDDDDVCTADSCDLITACGHAAIEGCCKSDDDCAANERCQLDTNSCLPESTSSSGSGGASGPIDGGSNGVSAPSASCSCRVLGSPATPSRNDVGWLLVIALSLGWRRRRQGVIQSRHSA